MSLKKNTLALYMKAVCRSVYQSHKGLVKDVDDTTAIFLMEAHGENKLIGENFRWQCRP